MPASGPILYVLGQTTVTSGPILYVLGQHKTTQDTQDTQVNTGLDTGYKGMLFAHAFLIYSVHKLM